jgi:hypothetical protein
VQALLGVDLRNDLAAALGGELAMAQDGPLLPLPSWKIAVEVYDPVKLQATIQKLLAAANAAANAPGLQLQQSTANGRTYYTFSSQSATPFTQLCYTYTDGYLLAGSSQALLDRRFRIAPAATPCRARLRLHGADPARSIRELLGGDLLQRLDAFAAAGAVQQAARRRGACGQLEAHPDRGLRRERPDHLRHQRQPLHHHRQHEPAAITRKARNPVTLKFVPS